MSKLFSKVKNFYIWLFSKIISLFKKVVNFNRRLIANIKTDFSNKRYLIGSFKLLGYGLFLLIQFLLFLLLLASYVMCKLTGVCLILPF